MKDLTYSVLINLGFEPKEAEVYLALLELGEARILKIAQKSGLNRASLYYILEKMKKRGLVTHLEKDGKDLFMPLDPAMLLMQHKKHVKEFESLIPELKGLLNKTGKRPFVRFFEGIEAVKSIYADTLTSRTEILNYANSREVRDHWPDYDKDYVEERTKRGIRLRGIAPDDEQGRKVQAQDQRYLRKTRLIDPKKLNFNNEIKIYDNKVAMMSFAGDVFGVVIESRDMADTQRAIFEMAWSFAGR